MTDRAIATEGYSDRLVSALRAAPVLPAQSLELDPELADKPAADLARPLRMRVLHKACDTTTAVKPEQAQDMARDPKSWSTCWCNVCGRRLGIDQFTWSDDGSPVGS